MWMMWDKNIKALVLKVSFCKLYICPDGGEIELWPAWDHRYRACSSSPGQTTCQMASEVVFWHWHCIICSDFKSTPHPGTWKDMDLRRGCLVSKQVDSHFYWLAGDYNFLLSGRKNPTGPGIYSFKCRRAENLFNLLQVFLHPHMFWANALKYSSQCSSDFKHFQTGSSPEPGSKCRARKCSKSENRMKNRLQLSLKKYLIGQCMGNILICKNAGSQSDGDPGCCHKQFQSNRCRNVSGWSRAKNEENGTWACYV